MPMPMLFRVSSGLSKCLFLSILALVLACGTRVGNPKQPTGGEGAGGEKVKVPDITYDDSAANYGLTSQKSFAATSIRFSNNANLINADDATHFLLPRMQILDSVRKLMEELKKSYATVEVGQKLSGQLGDVAYTGSVTKGADGRYVALLCKDKTKFMSLQWKDQDSEVTVIRDFSAVKIATIDAGLDFANKVRTGFAFVKSDKLSMAIEGSVGDYQTFGNDRMNQRDYSVFEKTAASEYKIRGTRKFFAKSDFSDSSPNTAYFSASLKNSILTAALHFSGMPRLCGDSFDPTAQSPDWCFGFKLQSDSRKVDLLSKSEAKALGFNKTSPGIASSADVPSLDFDKSIECP